jgi:NADPH:quinone reductase-like Zn-dependent oxidoreductase
MSNTVKIVRFHKTGPAEVLQFDELPLPEPGPGEIRLRVKAIGLNRAKVMFRNGQYLEAPVPPSKNGYEAAGIIEPVGPGVDASWIGKTVSNSSTDTHGEFAREDR